MEPLIQRLNQILQQEFPGSIPELEVVKPLQKVGGFLLWDGFDDLDQLDRQRKVSEVIREQLPPHEAVRVTTIFTMTPAEADVMRQP